MILFGIRLKALKLCCCLKKCNEIFGSWIYLVWQIISVNSYLVWRLAAADISAGVEREICGARLLRERFLLCPFSAPTLSHCIASFSFRIPPPLFLQKTPRSHSVENSHPLILKKKNPVSFCNNSYFFVHFPFLIQPIRHKNIGFSHSKEVFFSPF